MFKVIKTRKVNNWPAEVSVAQDDGKVQTYPITLDLELISSDAFRDASQKDGDKGALRRVIKGWSGIHDEAGDVMHFNAENLDVVLELANFRAAAFAAYFSADAGQGQAKN